MEFPANLTLERSASTIVRVEPPDVVIVEGAHAMRFRRAHVQQCRAMLVSYYRAHIDAALAGDPDDIVVQLRVEGMPAELLGPFPHADGIALADAINLTRRPVLFAVPGFSASISADDMELALDARTATGRRTVPVPTPELVEIVPRGDAVVDARYTIATGLAVASPQWLELRFGRGRPWLVGPLPSAGAAILAAAFRAWRAARPIDREPVEVTERELVDDPHRWHARRVAVTGTWSLQFESSRFAGAWLRTPDDGRHGHGTFRVRVVGTWVYPRTDDDRGYGHMGCWPGMLSAETLDILETIDTPDTAPDGLTRLATRRSVHAAFARFAAELPLAFALVNIDRLKRINDAVGHLEGDEVIRRIAATIAGAMPSSAFVARWAGDVFAILFPGTLAAAEAAITGALAAVRALSLHGATCSAGVVAVDSGEALSSVTGRADEALSQAQLTGRDRVVAG